MLVATTLMILGLLGGIIAAQLRGLRLGGVIIVPLFAIYALRSFGSIPVLVLSVIAAYVSLWYIKQRLFLYGRSLFIVSVVIGALVPLLVFEFLVLGYGPQSGLSGIEFIGSVLPGIAAYNLHRLSAEKRVMDAVWSLTLLLFLIVVGIGLVIFVGLTPLAGYLPTVLLGPRSDIAVAFGLQIDHAALPFVLSRVEALTLITTGLLLSEAIRFRWGLHIGGLIVLPLLVMFSVRNSWLLGLFVATTVVSYVSVQLFHWWMLVYGRVLLSMGIIVGLLTTISVSRQLPVEHGLLPFFVAILAGVTAYNMHVMSPRERPACSIVTAGAFVGMFGVTRLLVTPLEAGLLREVTLVHVGLGTGILLAALWVLYRLEVARPDKVRFVSQETDETVSQPRVEL